MASIQYWSESATLVVRITRCIMEVAQMLRLVPVESTWAAIDLLGSSSTHRNPPLPYPVGQYKHWPPHSYDLSSLPDPLPIPSHSTRPRFRRLFSGGLGDRRLLRYLEVSSSFCAPPYAILTSPHFLSDCQQGTPPAREALHASIFRHLSLGFETLNHPTTQHLTLRI
jgi:hypothetical protein